MKNIEVVKITISTENPADRYNGKTFKELVASIKEKGVLMPILVRPRGKKYEVIAGARRLRAAEQAELKKIPARVVEMSDTEAREARIVENLQREDVHPLEEGESYRKLIEFGKKTKYDIVELAKQVGKSEKYVRDRMVLTNLLPKGKKLFRDGEMSITHATIIARADEARQKKALRLYDSWGEPNTQNLVDELQELTFKDLMKNPPWKNDEQMKAVLDENDVDGEQVDLFGKRASDEYRDPVAFARKMAAFIQIKIQEAEKAGAPILKISTEWGNKKQKGVLDRERYARLDSKEDQKKSKNPQKAIVVEGNDLGRIHVVTTEPDEIRQGQYGGSYKLSSKEKAERKKQREKAKKEAEAHTRLIARVVAKAEKTPAARDKKFVSAIFGLRCGNLSVTTSRPICKRRGIEAVRVKNFWGEGTHLDYGVALSREAKKMSASQMLGLVVECFCVDSYNAEDVRKLNRIL